VSGPGSSVGIATDYGLDGPGMESRWGRDFSHLSRPVLGLLYIGYRVTGGKVGGAWCLPSTPPSADVGNEKSYYLYCPLGPSWPVIGWPLHLYRELHKYITIMMTIIIYFCISSNSEGYKKLPDDGRLLPKRVGTVYRIKNGTISAYCWSFLLRLICTVRTLS
jgi:hypothetical protein